MVSTRPTKSLEDLPRAGHRPGAGDGETAQSVVVDGDGTRLQESRNEIDQLLQLGRHQTHTGLLHRALLVGRPSRGRRRAVLVDRRVAMPAVVAVPGVMLHLSQNPAAVPDDPGRRVVSFLCPVHRAAPVGGKTCTLAFRCAGIHGKGSPTPLEIDDPALNGHEPRARCSVTGNMPVVTIEKRPALQHQPPRRRPRNQAADWRIRTARSLNKCSSRRGECVKRKRPALVSWIEPAMGEDDSIQGG